MKKKKIFIQYKLKSGCNQAIKQVRIISMKKPVTQAETVIIVLI